MNSQTQSKAQQHTVLVTGAKGALGSSVCQRFLAEGHCVIGVDIAVDSRNQLKEDGEISGLYWMGLDLTDPGAIKEGINQIEEAHGSVDSVVHCAGGFRFAYGDEFSDDDIDFLLNANLRSTALLLRSVIPIMKKQNFGRIVLISSKSTLMPGAGEGPYAASKAGVNALTTALSREIHSFNMTINALLPSIIDTPANRDAMPQGDFDNWVKIDELCDIIYALTQPFGNPINGALIPVMGRM